VIMQLTPQRDQLSNKSKTGGNICSSERPKDLLIRLPLTRFSFQRVQFH
jgi:hypothetical protein